MYNAAEFVNLLSNFGFPVVITLYLLFRFEKRIFELESAIDELSDVIKKLGGK